VSSDRGVTVIIRTIGRPTLHAALMSVASQKVADLEVVIVAASAGITSPIVEGLHVRTVGGGRRWQRSEAASLGLSEVTTRWALFLDDDDELLPGHLHKLIEALAKAPDAVLAHTGVELVRQGHGQEAPVVFDTSFENWELLLGNRIPIHAALFDAQLAHRHGISFDPGFDLYEDWDFWLQLRAVGSFVHVPGVSARYLVSESSSEVHRVAFGDEAYWRVWRKWWPLAPRAWWTAALQQAMLASDLRREAIAQRVDLGAKLDAQHAELVEARHEIWRLGVQLSQAQSELVSAHQQTAGLQKSMVQMRADLSQTQAELAVMAAEIVVRRDAAALAERRLSETHGTLAHERLELARRDLQMRQVRDQLGAVLESSSWRLTAPLRQLADRLRSLQHGLARWRRASSWRRRWLSPGQGCGYASWIAGFEADDRARRRAELAQPRDVMISVLMPVFNPNLQHLDAAIESVLAQSHARWQLCLADDASTASGVREHLARWRDRDPRIRLVERSTNGHISACSNTALTLAQGDWVALLDQDDLLSDLALAEMADAIALHPQASVFFSDEDKIDADGTRFEPYFKPAFNIELMRSQNLVSHLGVYRRALVEEIGGFREGFEGSQDHDLALRCIERLRADQIVHVPRVLYHWRVSPGSTSGGSEQKPYAASAGLSAVSDHLSRVAPGSTVERLRSLSYFRVRHPLPIPPPLVLAIVAVPQVDAKERNWAAGLVQATNYPSFEVELVEEAGPVATFRALTKRASAGELPDLVLLLAPMLEVAHEGWLAELVSEVVRDGVGMAGGRVDSPQGELLQGAMIGGLRMAWAESGRQRHGHFGRARLTQGVSAVSGALLLLRRELLAYLPDLDGLSSLQQVAWLFCGAVRRAGWRIVWTPHAILIARDGASVRQVVGDELSEGATDPAFHPHLRHDGGDFVVGQGSVDVQPRVGF